ncbi:ribosomal L32p protein family-domain-containing protein [Linnemannia elongata]|nr:ribosomal L32p protein family-domain-containing protein [Linnemannia elongata]KAK5815852.1 ribosomal L32p protein family-domain-containing protein [Linnemannia elongata]
MSLLRTASRATQPARNLTFLRAFNSYSLAFTSPFNTSSSNSTVAASPATASAALGEVQTSVLGRLGSYISDLMPSIVWASVPKSKTSHSKKRMRQATKGLKEQRNIVECPGCGQPKLMHHLCQHCYRDMKGRGPSSNAEA